MRCADGGTAFVKAVGTELNADTPQLHRAESVVAAALPPEVPAPQLRFCYDDGQWVALVFDASPGRLPALPWSPAEAGRVMAAVVGLAETLTPCPVPGLPAASDRLREDLMSWHRLAADPPPDLNPWETVHLPELAGLAADLVGSGSPLDGETLVHLDLRADNILLEPHGRVSFLDWPWACRGARWLDPVLFALDPLVSGGVDPDALLADRAALAGVEADAVTRALLGLAGMWAEASRKPVPPAMPTIREHQRRWHDAALAWGRRRAGWD